MSVADFVFKQGDTRVVATDALTLSDGTPVNLQGATVKFVMRAQSSATAVALTGATTVTGALQGTVQFSPSSADTSIPGQYMASWVVTFVDGSVMTFPTEGYLWVSIEENLTTAGGQQLVGLPDVKDYLNIDRGDRRHDAKLIRVIHAIRPLIEEKTGPIIPQVFDEWHDGGQYFIQVRRRPSTAYGCTPILNLLGVDEYSGPIKYSLAIVPDPAAGSIYSVFIDRLGRITRRSSGGGTTPFAGGLESVHVTYQAGQQSVPPNVYEAALEWIRANHDNTESVGRGSLTVADDQDAGNALKVGMPRYVHQMLAPNRRASSIA